MKQMKHLLVVAAALCAAPALAQTYEVEPSHSHLSWSTSHWGLSTYRGKFTRAAGKLSIDRAAKSASVELTIDAASQISGDDRLDKHLAAEDFFNVAKFPTIAFRSKRVEFSGDAPSRVEGELTLLGITRPVTLQIGSFRCLEDRIQKTKERCGGDASATIRRSDWGMKFAIPAIGDEVKLDLQLEVLRDK